MKKSVNLRTRLLTVCALTFGGLWALQPQRVAGAENKIDPVRIFDSQTVAQSNTMARFSDVYTVPAGKRLVVEHVSCAFLLHPPDLLTCGIFATTRGHHHDSEGLRHIACVFAMAGLLLPLALVHR